MGISRNESNILLFEECTNRNYEAEREMAKVGETAFLSRAWQDAISKVFSELFKFIINFYILTATDFVVIVLRVT